MQKTILLTGATDGIGLVTAERLVSEGHHLLLHGRNPAKLEQAMQKLAAIAGDDRIETYLADLSRLAEVEKFADAVLARHQSLDVLVNNAGVFRTSDPISADGLDVRFAVNTLAPYRLTRRLLPLLGASSRVVNLSSAAQAPVDVEALDGRLRFDDEFAAYAQSKLAITMWSRHMAQEFGDNGPAVIAVNPGSLLASKMVTEGFGVAGNDLGIGADILCRAALSEAFSDASGRYFDNDSGKFAPPHADALDAAKCSAVVDAIEAVLARISSGD